MPYSKILLLVGGLLCLLLCSSVLAEIPQVISYQGYITDTEGNPVEDGTFFLKFKIYGSDTGDDSLWSSGFQSITVSGGLFNYQIGSFNPLPQNLFTAGAIRYLGITIGTDAEISPRTRIMSSAYAYKAQKSDTADIAEDVSDNSITGAKIQPNAITSAHIAAGTIMAGDVNNSEIQLRVTGDCPPGYYISSIDADGNISCVEDQIGSGGDITAVYGDNGLTGTATEGDAHLSVGAGNGIVVNPDNIEVDVDGLAGSGLVESSDKIHVNVGHGLELFVDSVRLNADYRNGVPYDSRFVNENQVSSITSSMVIDDNLTNADIADEPGATEKEYNSNGSAGERTLALGMNVIDSLTIDCPAGGLVLAIVTFTLQAHGVTEAYNYYALFGISQSRTIFPENLEFSFRLDKVYNDYTWRWPMTVHYLIPVTAGEQEFFFLGNLEQDGNINIWDIQMSLVYLPTSYAVSK
ncbi:MAG: hypothetical protein AB1746_06895 [Candidatus Zixiibacteriota bacterium]